MLKINSHFIINLNRGKVVNLYIFIYIVKVLKHSGVFFIDVDNFFLWPTISIFYIPNRIYTLMRRITKFRRSSVEFWRHFRSKHISKKSNFPCSIYELFWNLHDGLRLNRNVCKWINTKKKKPLFSIKLFSLSINLGINLWQLTFIIFIYWSYYTRIQDSELWVTIQFDRNFNHIKFTWIHSQIFTF